MLRHKRAGKAIVDTDWSSQKGRRPAIASINDMQDFAKFIDTQNGRTHDNQDMKEYLENLQSKRMIAAGYVPLGLSKVSPKSVDNYMALAGNDENVYNHRNRVKDYYDANCGNIMACFNRPCNT